MTFMIVNNRKPSLYRKYIDGKIESVWQELTILNQTPSQLDDLTWNDISKLLTETMRRSRENIDIIISALKEVDYQFMDLGSAGWEEKRKSSQLPVYSSPIHDECEQKFSLLRGVNGEQGYLPLSFIKFIEEVGSVNFIGYFPDWVEKENFPLLDPLMVFPIEELISYHKYLTSIDGERLHSKSGSYLQFSYDEDAKEGSSGSGLGYGIKIYSQPQIEGVLTNYGYTIDFVNYLRLCFKWGGFPNLEWFQDSIDPRFKSLIKGVSKQLIPM